MIDYDVRKAHEDHVSNRTGCSPYQLFIVLNSVLVLYNIRTSLNASKTIARYFFDFLLIASIYPFLVYCEGYFHLFLLFFYTAKITLFIYSILHRFSPLMWWPQADLHLLTHSARMVNSFILIATASGILAIDLPMTPEMIVKVENYGISLSDVFVGLFSFSAGFSTAMHRGKTKKFIFRAFLPCLLLGIGRTVVLQAINYPQHVTEYGKHWNFFFTLAFIRLYGFLLHQSSIARQAAVAVFTAFAHVVFLRIYNVYGKLDPTKSNSWIYHPDSRNHSILVANAEGIFSLPGYFAISALGSLLFQCLNSTKRRLIVFMILFGTIFLTTTSYIFLPGEYFCRRLVNLPYILAVISCWTITFVYMYIFHLSMRSNVFGPLLLTCNRFGMTFFLLANLLTGAVNISVDTLKLNKIEQLLVITLYLLALSVLVTLYAKLYSKIASLFKNKPK